MIVIALAALLLAGCKQGRLVTERRTMESDSTAVWLLRDSLQLQERQIALLRSDLKHLREENVSLRSEGLQYEIRYDTAAPIDSLTGRPPVMSERFTAHNSRQKKTVSNAELQQREWSLERESLTRANSSLLLSVEQLTRENRELKEKTTLPSPFKRLLLPAGIILTILLLLWLLLFRK
jgi:hypothetical protein